MSRRKSQPYREGELEIILSLAPTEANITWLSTLLERSKDAIEVVYKIAFEHGPFGGQAGVQELKILEAKARAGITIGRKGLRKDNSRAILESKSRKSPEAIRVTN